MNVEIEVEELEIAIDRVIAGVSNLIRKNTISFEAGAVITQELHNSFERLAGRKINTHVGKESNNEER